MNKVLDFPKRDLGDSRSTHNTWARLRPVDLPANRTQRLAATIDEPGIRPDSALLIRIALLQAMGKRIPMTEAVGKPLSPPEVEAVVIHGLLDLAERGCPTCQMVLHWLGARRMAEAASSMERAND